MGPDASATKDVEDADARLAGRLDRLCDDGWALWEQFDGTVRAPTGGRSGRATFHPFVAADYAAVRAALLPLRRPGRRCLEWGSATGVITVMADLMGFEACGIELDPSLVAAARALAARHESAARFAVGSFLPTGYTWRAPDGDRRTGTIGEGPSGYLQLGRALDDFDVVFGYPWGGEEALMHDLMRRYGRPDALLLLYDASEGVCAYRGGRAVRPPAGPLTGNPLSAPAADPG
ncbi:hypothetical protein tb265_24800 [Gemmatimonadetes bacterium T265]|nr:hypothetical protein tb265_24800 [Gemmatimonadetes bacterium T265]